MADWTSSAIAARNLVAVFRAMLVAMAVAGAVGCAFERVLVRPVYGQHLKQILITMGGMIIGEELIKVIWGPAADAAAAAQALRGSILLGDAAIEKYRLLAVAIGAVVLVAMLCAAQPHQDRLADPRRRAGPRDGREPRLPHRRLFIGVFVAGSALAGLGGVLWGLYQQLRDSADRRAGQRAALHRDHHRRAGLDARAA